jgi:hypothetical protein
MDAMVTDGLLGSACKLRPMLSREVPVREPMLVLILMGDLTLLIGSLGRGAFQCKLWLELSRMMLAATGGSGTIGTEVGGLGITSGAPGMIENSEPPCSIGELPTDGSLRVMTFRRACQRVRGLCGRVRISMPQSFRLGCGVSCVHGEADVASVMGEESPSSERLKLGGLSRPLLLKELNGL